MKINNVRIIESNAPVYDIEIDSEDHLYAMADVVTHNCCRLINNSELFDLGGQVNSFGGSALSLGSHRVCTINMRRITLLCNSWEDYKNILIQRMDEAEDILIAHRALLRDLIAKGTQPFMENGWLDLDRMFSTIGLLGYYEAASDLKQKFGDRDYIGEMIDVMESHARQLTVEKHNVTNLEQIPAESMSYKASKTDKWIFGEEKIPENIYANQFVPLWEDVTLCEKFAREGDLADRLSGGGIIHYSCGEKITPKQALYIIDEAAKDKVAQFAINPTFSICENDHYTFGQHEICPKCGAPIVDAITRTVGFFTHTKDWATEKREYDYKRRHYRSI